MISALLTFVFAQTSLANASETTNAGARRHKACLARIAQDSALAHEEAMIWQSEGGGRRARHCVAMALFALGHEGEAAYRLEKLAQSPDGGSDILRIGYYVQAADMWLQAGAPQKAIDAGLMGLEIDISNIDLRIARARGFGALEQWADAQRELTTALIHAPNEPRVLRYRADTYLRQAKLRLAKADIDKSVQLNVKDIDSLLLRGRINEAIRLAALKAEK